MTNGFLNNLLDQSRKIRIFDFVRIGICAAPKLAILFLPPTPSSCPCIFGDLVVPGLEQAGCDTHRPDLFILAYLYHQLQNLFRYRASLAWYASCPMYRAIELTITATLH